MITLILYSTIIIFIFYILKNLLFFEKIDFKNNFKIINSKERILLANTEQNFVGGGEIYTINLYKKLLEQVTFASIIITKNSALEKELKREKLPYYAYNKFYVLKNVIQPGLFVAIYLICKKNKINIFHSNFGREIKTIRHIAKILKFKIVNTKHISDPVKMKEVKNLDGLICVNPQITNNMLEKQKFYGIKKIEFIPPFCNDKKFLSFQEPKKENKKTFFKNNFNININPNIPIITIIASLCDRKKQSLLFQATQKLIFEKNKLVQILCVGHGNNGFPEKLFELVEKLNIKQYVHFLGFTTKIPEVLFYSDIKVLPSLHEGLPISLIEAAFMKKPLIGTNNSGMEHLIKHKKTGLLFEKNNVDSLVEQIETFLDNPELQKELGQNAYDFVKENFAIEASMKKINSFYQRILS